jgi:hypothetical protein
MEEEEKEEGVEPINEIPLNVKKQSKKSIYYQTSK